MVASEKIGKLFPKAWAKAKLEQTFNRAIFSEEQ